MTDDRTKRPDWPLSGPVDDTVDEATDRFTLLDDTPQIQAAFRRLAVRFDEMERRIAAQRSDDLTSIRDEFLNLDEKLRVRLEAVSTEMRERDHKVRADAAAAVGEVSNALAAMRGDLVQHELADTAIHADLTGKSGTNGRVGALSWKVKVIFAILAAIGTAALGSVGMAYKAIRESGEKSGEWAEWRRQVDDERDETEKRLDAHGGALWRLGAFTPAAPAGDHEP